MRPPATPQTTVPTVEGAVVVHDVDDLAEADRDADLAERLEELGRTVAEARHGRPGTADAVALAWAIGRSAADALAVHRLGLRAALLAG